MFPMPTSVFLTRGVGVHRHLLTAFEFALRDADIEQQNLVTVSSILPPRCEAVPREAGVATLRPGEITFCVMARSETNEPGRRIHASIGLARPADPAMYGYISEHHGYGMTRRRRAASMPRTSPRPCWRPPSASSSTRTRPGTSASASIETSNLIIGSTSLTAAAEGDAGGRWTCAVAAAVFRFAPPRRPRANGERPTFALTPSFLAIEQATPTPRSALPAFRSTSAPRTAAAPASGRPRSGRRAGCWWTATHPPWWVDPAALSSPTSAISASRSATSRRAWR